MRKLKLLALVLAASALMGACGAKIDSAVPVPTAAVPLESASEAVDLTQDECAVRAVTVIREYLDDAEEVTLTVAPSGAMILDGRDCYVFQAIDSQPDKMLTLGFYAFSRDMKDVYRLDEMTDQYVRMEESEG